MSILRTIISIPGRNKSANKASEAPVAASQLRGSNAIMMQNRMLVGVLYSVSKDLCGEIYPVYVGRNTIGNSPENDIVLREASVSPHHGLLLVRRVTDEAGETEMYMSLSPFSGETVIKVNDSGNLTDRISLRGNDLICIGSQYSFRFVALTPEMCGLSVADGFRALPAMVNTIGEKTEYSADKQQENIPTSISEADERSFYAPTRPKAPDENPTVTVVD